MIRLGWAEIRLITKTATRSRRKTRKKIHNRPLLLTEIISREFSNEVGD